MAGYDPDVFGSSSAPAGYDPDVFGSPEKTKLTRQQIADNINNDPISKGARDFASQGSDALGGLSQFALNVLGGAVRGAGSIGATIARPFETNAENDQRRARLDENMGSVGADPGSYAYKGSKLGAEVAGTLGVGGAIAAPFKAISAAAAGGGAGAIPGMDAVATALASGGLRTGAQLPFLQNLALRTGAGAVTGAASAGLVNPDDAAMGAAIGAAVPGVVGGLGAAGSKLNSALSFGSVQPTERLLDTARQSMDAGYKIPPNMVKPSFTNQLIESVSGKQATSQLASVENAKVTERLTKQALGIPEDVQLTSQTLGNLRETAGTAYAEVSSLSPQAAADLEALKTARNDAQGWFKAYNRSARPDDLAKAKEARALSDSLETSLEQHAADAGKPELIPALRDARKEIAKTYTVGRALNDASGTVDARVLGRMYEKGLPLSDGLDVAGRFASAFPSVAKTPQAIGSPAAHNLKAALSALMGGGGWASLGPAGAAAAALPYVAPPVARSIMFSQAAQRGLLADPIATNAPLGLLTQAGYRAAPLLASD